VTTLSPDGSSAPVSAPAVLPKAPVTVPSPPTITATTPGSGSITVTWTAPATGGSAITGYQLLNGSQTLSVGPTVRKATLTGLAKNTRTRVVVRAKNDVGWSAYAYSPYVTTKK
jgi:large repetitive protein